jgi:PilZ domain
MNMFVHAQQRETIRRAVQIPCQVVRERDFKLIGARTVDLSPHGMLVKSEADVLPDERLIVSFRATAFNLWFDTEAVVTRIVSGRRPGDPGRCLGVRFRTLDAVARHILRGSLRKVPPPVPRRERRMDYAATVRRITAEVPPLVTARDAQIRCEIDRFFFDD